MRRISNVDELYEWLGRAGRRHEAIYHEGHLAADRLRSRSLSQLADTVMRLQAGKLVTVTHKRDGTQWQYIIQIVTPLTARQIVDLITTSPLRKKS